MFRAVPTRSLLSLAAVLSIASGTSEAAAADLGEVSVPATTQWCLERSAAIDDVANPVFQQAEIGQVMLAIGKAGATIGVTEFGVPSADHADRIDDNNVKITYCANIDAVKQPPAGTNISSRKRPAVKVVGKVCDGGTIDACEAELVAALEGVPWKLTPDVATGLVHFVSDIPATGAFEARVVAAVNNAHSQLYDPAIGLVIVKPVTGPQNTILALGLP
jgi:hypothetical protein